MATFPAILMGRIRTLDGLKNVKHRTFVWWQKYREESSSQQFKLIYFIVEDLIFFMAQA